jgi:hypothetical protein
MLRPGLIIPVGIFVLGALALIWSVAATTGGKRAVGPRYTKDVIDDGAVRDLQSNAQDGRMADVATATVGVVLGIDGCSETTKLAEAVADTVSAYGDESIEYYFSVLERQGVEPPEIAASNPEWADKSWNLSRLLIAGADIDDRAIRVEPVESGEGYRHPDSSVSIQRSSRDSARSFLSEFPGGTLEQVDVVLPGSFLAQDGDRFDGVFVMRYTYDPMNGVWVFTEQRLYGVPNGVLVVLPPL